MTRDCASCGKPFTAQRSTARYCSAACRKRASRRGGGPEVVADTPTPAPEDESGLVAAVRRELEAADRVDSVLGQQALRLAERMGAVFDTGSAVASLSKELRAVMDAALADAPRAADALDELSERRKRKASGA